MEYGLLEGNTESFVTLLYESPDCIQYPYHNLAHTKRVVAKVKELARFYAVTEENICALSLAAWFHDVGQLYGQMEGHEQRSAVIMTDYLNSNHAPAAFISLVSSLIMVTQKNADPQTLEEKIICDADTWNFGTPFFRETEFMVKKEIAMRTGLAFEGWHSKSLQLLQNHVYFTEYAQLQLNNGKRENIEWLQTLIVPGTNR